MLCRAESPEDGKMAENSLRFLKALPVIVYPTTDNVAHEILSLVSAYPRL